MAANRVRVEYRDAYRNRVQTYVSPKEAKFLSDNKIATFKNRSEREMNLRHGWMISRDNFGLIELTEVCFLSQEPRQFIQSCIERWHKLRLNCYTWANRSTSVEPYKPLKLILSI